VEAVKKAEEAVSSGNITSNKSAAKPRRRG
jgi:hypothetical protein